MLSISTGYSVSYLTGAVAAGRESYYTGAVTEGEPPGRWYGRGAHNLGLSGIVDEQDITALYEHRIDPRDSAFRDLSSWGKAERLGGPARNYLTAEEMLALALSREPDALPERIEELRLHTQRKERQNVAFFDVTFSVQKSITVLHAAFEAQEVAARRTGDEATAQVWAERKEAVEQAIWTGNQAALDYLEEHAGYTRVGHHGGSGGRFLDAHEWVVASFFQHDSRDHDPQLHIHNAILNRVEAPDGVWRTIYSPAIYKERPAAAAIAERVTEEHLRRSLGVEFATRPDGKAREIRGIDKKVLDLFSTRRRAITERTIELVKRFEAFHNRSPNPLELDRLHRQATFATRKPKTHEAESQDERLARWDRELRTEVATSLAAVAENALAQTQKPTPTSQWSPQTVIKTALTRVQEQKATWTEAELKRAISDSLPDHLGGRDARDVTRVINELAAAGVDRGAVRTTAPGPAEDSLPDDLKLANGHSQFEAPSSTRYTTAEHLQREQDVTDATREQAAPALHSQSADLVIEELADSGIELGQDQASAVRGILTSGRNTETLVGPAGTGKSFVIGVVAKAWQDEPLWNGVNHRAVGLAASQIATDVLSREGLQARNTTRWLATQERLQRGAASEDDLAWKLQPGDLVVVDESSIAATQDIAAIQRHAQRAGAKVLLTGDHKQLAAVGPTGAMELTTRNGTVYELSEVRRLQEPWEKDASLRLREGDASALLTYRNHGRLIDAGTAEMAQHQAMQGFLGDLLSGKDTILITDTNEQAARLSAQTRAELVRLGRVQESGVPLGQDGTIAGIGDIVQARRNGWELIGYQQNRRAPINRERYQVTHVLPDGALRVQQLLAGSVPGDTLTLPAQYVSSDLSLGYAGTAHSAQGLTVDTSHVVASAHTRRPSLYVGLTRGEQANTAYVATVPVQEDLPIGTAHDVKRKDPVALLAQRIEEEKAEQAAIQEREASAAEARSIRTAAERLSAVSDLAVAGRTSASLDRLTDQGILTRKEREALAADRATSGLSQILRRAELAGHDPEQILEDAIRKRPLTGSASIASVLHHRIQTAVALEPQGDSYTAWIPTVQDPSWQTHLADLAHAAEARRAELGEHTVTEQPRWALAALGPVPEDVEERDEWRDRAATIAAHRELTGHTDEESPLPRPPQPGQTVEYASWRASWRALGSPEADRAEAEMSEGQLRIRVRAYERQLTWEPAYVAPELSETSQAEARHRQLSAIRTAAADAARSAVERERLSQEAAESAALADLLGSRRKNLEEADEIRSLWYAHTAPTRDAAQRARSELASRGIDADHTGDETTAEDWLTANQAAERDEDAVRPIRDEEDLYDVHKEREAATATLRRPQEVPHENQPAERDTPTSQRGTTDVANKEPQAPPPTPKTPSTKRPETPQPERSTPPRQRGRTDIGTRPDAAARGPFEREPVTTQPAERPAHPPKHEETATHNRTRVPDAEETQAAVNRAREALTRIREEQAAERHREREERYEMDSHRWQTDEASDHQPRSTTTPVLDLMAYARD